MLATEIVSIAEHRHAEDIQRCQQASNNVIVQIAGQLPSERLRTIGIELVEKRGEA